MHQAQPWRLSVMELKQRAAAAQQHREKWGFKLKQRAAAVAAARREVRLPTEATGSSSHSSTERREASEFKEHQPFFTGEQERKKKKGIFKQFCCIREGCDGNCYMLRVRNVKMYPHWCHELQTLATNI